MKASYLIHIIVIRLLNTCCQQKRAKKNILGEVK